MSGTSLLSVGLCLVFEPDPSDGKVGLETIAVRSLLLSGKCMLPSVWPATCSLPRGPVVTTLQSLIQTPGMQVFLLNQEIRQSDPLAGP